MKTIESTPPRRRDDDPPIPRAAVAARPISRRAAASPAPARRPVVDMSDGLRHAIHDHAQSAGAPAAHDSGTAGLFSQAINAGVHDAPAGEALGGTLGGVGAAATASPQTELVRLRMALAPNLQTELDRLAATPEGLAAIQAELHAGGGPAIT